MEAKRDQNFVASALGVSSSDSITTLPFLVNPITGRLLVDSSGGGSGTQVYNEVVAGSGTAWTLAFAPTAGTQRIYANGQRLTLTVDYSIVGAAITTVSPWSAGTLLADYTH